MMPEQKPGVRIPVWAIGLLFGFIANLVAAVIIFAEVRTNQEHLRDNVSEIKFRVGNIQDGMGDMRDDKARLEVKCDGFERRITHLEDQD